MKGGDPVVSIIKAALRWVMFSSPVFRLLVKVFKVVAVTGKGSSLCMENGFLPVRVDFHSPIPDIADLDMRGVWESRTEMKGIDFKEDGQRELLSLLGKNYSAECRWPLSPTDDPFEFYVENVSFSFGCAASTHCIIRHFKPKTVIEIGSGMSSRVITKAIGLNRLKEDHTVRHVIVDPYPSEGIIRSENKERELVKNRVECLPAQWFDQLQSNDILFIDSGHCVRIGGDVNYLFLEVLPRLRPGVIVHVHDIGLPYEYPKVYATNESFRQFWTEQYLLQAFLSCNTDFAVLLAMNYLMKDHLAFFKESFPDYDPRIHRLSSSSFWMRRRR